MVALQGVQHILWRNWNCLKCTTIILLVTSKHCFSSTEFIPKDNHLIIDIITVLKDGPQASVDAAKTFLQIAGGFLVQKTKMKRLADVTKHAGFVLLEWNVSFDFEIVF